MGDFKWRHFRGKIILWAVRWYCKYGISYREPEDRGVALVLVMPGGCILRPPGLGQWRHAFFEPRPSCVRHARHPAPRTADKASCYGIAITELKKEGKLRQKTQHRQVKYLNNIVEADHGKLKRLIRPTLGFKTMKTAYATIKGFDREKLWSSRRLREAIT